MLLMISEVVASCESKNPTSCLRTASKYLYRILSTWRSLVRLQQYPSASISPSKFSLRPISFLSNLFKDYFGWRRKLNQSIVCLIALNDYLFFLKLSKIEHGISWKRPHHPIFVIVIVVMSPHYTTNLCVYTSRKTSVIDWFHFLGMSKQSP